MNNSIKLILLDLDGTLLDEQSKVPSNLAEVVSKLKEKDVIIGIASGRNFGLIKNDFLDVYQNMSIVSSNGCSVRLNGVVVFDTGLTKEESLKIFNKWEEIKNETSIQIMSDDLFIADKTDPIVEYFGAVEGNGIHITDNIVNELDKAKLLSVCAKDMKTDYSNYFVELSDEIEIVESGYGCVDFMPKGISKAIGVIKLCEAMHISIDQVMAIGDASNDLDLLKTVGCPVAMANGNEEVKKIAKYQTSKTNKDNGCLEFIEEFFNL